ncbi:hypothetical protein [Burkholderia cepacia]|uniref:hypothetical protein n=1 Tax=Burkholderia cepacia TaxID=292 RepID=UPI001CC56BA8|nr:hypothetical protein [Burkholderia cepacia]
MTGARTPGFTKRAAATAARFHFRVRPAVETNNRRISIPSFFYSPAVNPMESAAARAAVSPLMPYSLAPERFAGYSQAREFTET